MAHQCAVGRHAPSPQLRYVSPIIIKNHGPHLGHISEHIRGRAANREERELGSRVVHITCCAGPGARSSGPFFTRSLTHFRSHIGFPLYLI